MTLHLRFSIALALLAPLAANAQAERSEEVRIASDPEVVLAGTLHMPPRPAGARVPAVLLLGGGGPSPRGIYPMLEQRLRAAGIATLSYDKRGIGQSTGTFVDTMDLMERDAAAALAFLQARPDIDTGRIAILGLSQGGVIGPRLAVRDRSVAGIVMLAAPAGKQHDLFLDGMREHLRKAGMGDESIALILPRARAFLDARAAGLAQNAPSPSRASLSDAFVVAGWTREQAAGAVTMLDDPVLVSMYQVDAAGTLARLRAPILVVYAGDDTVVPTPLNLPQAKSALRDNGDATVVAIPRMNHGFQPIVTDAAGKSEHKGWPVSAPEVVDLIAVWLDDRLGKRKRPIPRSPAAGS